MLAEQGNKVIWWSSDFSHLKKAKRQECPDTDGFSIRLIKTPLPDEHQLGPPEESQSICKWILRNRDGRTAIETTRSPQPNRRFPAPLGVAEQAFKIRHFVNKEQTQRHSQPHDHFALRSDREHHGCLAGNILQSPAQMDAFNNPKDNPLPTAPQCKASVH